MRAALIFFNKSSVGQNRTQSTVMRVFSVLSKLKSNIPKHLCTLRTTKA